MSELEDLQKSAHQVTAFFTQTKARRTALRCIRRDFPYSQYNLLFRENNPDQEPVSKDIYIELTDVYKEFIFEIELSDSDEIETLANEVSRVR